MKISEIMSTNVQSISSSAMVSEAAQKMKEFDVGVLPVLEDNKIVGMLTDRDIVLRVITAGKDSQTTSVKDVFTSGVICCSQEDDLQTAAQMMEENQVRRLVVLGEEQTVVGIVSVGDIALKSGEEHTTYEVLEKVCEPAHS